MNRHVRSATREVEYPESDGKPMGETDLHRREMQSYAIEVLEDFFAADPEVYVSGNNFIYYREGHPRECVSPDTYVVRGVAKRLRNTYKVWEEGGRKPCFVLEVTSRKTHREDKLTKLALYHMDLEVPEYFLYDPLGDWIPEHLRGYRRNDEMYVPIAPVDGRFRSEQLGLDLIERDGHVRFLDPRTGALLPTRTERADAEGQRADALAMEVAALREELARLKGQAGGQAPPV